MGEPRRQHQRPLPAADTRASAYTSRAHARARTRTAAAAQRLLGALRRRRRGAARERLGLVQRRRLSLPQRPRPGLLRPANALRLRIDPLQRRWGRQLGGIGCLWP